MAMALERPGKLGGISSSSLWSPDLVHRLRASLCWHILITEISGSLTFRDAPIRQWPIIGV